LSLIGPPDAPIAVAMRSLVIRLIALVAVMVMPLGMSAAAEGSGVPELGAAMPMEHCPEGNQAPAGKAALADCAMACAAALPAADLAAIATPDVLPRLVEPAFILALVGIELEIATPPPRLS